MSVFAVVLLFSRASPILLIKIFQSPAWRDKAWLLALMGATESKVARGSQQLECICSLDLPFSVQFPCF